MTKYIMIEASRTAKDEIKVDTASEFVTVSIGRIDRQSVAIRGTICIE